MPRRPVDALEDLVEIYQIFDYLEKWGRRMLIFGFISLAIVLTFLA
jgi:hypothetical protein